MYKVLVLLDEDWMPVIDVQKSRSTKVERIFMSEEEANTYIKKTAGLSDENAKLELIAE